MKTSAKAKKAAVKPSVAKKVNAMKKATPAPSVTQTIADTANNISDSVKQAVASYDWNKEVVGVGVGIAGREVYVAASTKDLIQATGIAAAVAGVCYLVMK